MKKQMIKLSELRNIIKEELSKGKKVIKEYTSDDKSNRGSELAMNYVLKIRKDFKIKKFTDDEVEDFTKYLKNELGL